MELLLEESNNDVKPIPKIELTHFSDYDDDDDYEDSDDSSDEDYFQNEDDKKSVPLKLESQKLDTPLVCSSCDQGFDHNTAFFEHKLATIECMLAQRDCNICCQIIDGDRNDVKMHVANHLLPRTYYCKYCERDENASVIQQYEHLYHMLGEHFFICALCGESFEENDDLWRHIPSIHPNAEGISKQNLVDIKPLRETREPKQTSSSPSRPMCDLCGTFVTSIQIHMESHQLERPYVCNTCDSSFRTKRCLVKHEQSHKTINGFDCEFCDKRFHTTKSFIMHMNKIHPTNSDELFPCQYCRSKFTHRQIREIHETLHRTFACNLCHKEYKIYKQLHTHLKVDHPETLASNSMNTNFSNNLPAPYRCNVCLKIFYSKNDIDEHMNTHTNEPQNEELLTDNEQQQQQQEETTAKIINFTISPAVVKPSTTNVKHLVLKPIKFKCKECDTTFKNESSYVHHKMEVHKKKFRCVTCCLLTENIIIHMREHRFCGLCKIDFGSVTGLKEHERVTHGDEALQ